MPDKAALKVLRGIWVKVDYISQHKVQVVDLSPNKVEHERVEAVTLYQSLLLSPEGFEYDVDQLGLAKLFKVVSEEVEEFGNSARLKTSCVDPVKG